ncbi:GNAT family N-acetyltransferase [Christiangramia flava]|uniref:Putative acetyltransferase n=1 Tax=Christiangramia flava JLT2011 TaxID=1229726 RepID=A0A1L7I2B0_9FLAO|nr:GNAT family N-acetyltransferase [Christiangramia flava]APU67323.1 Putative acetyltransferase [Christiangramia flava JLT2011]OSS39908.1 GCN5-related N-acetyltransferase [Christiangramia flava JLT2011]
MRTILHSHSGDMAEIFQLYSEASAYQKAKKTVVVWPEFERSLVEREIREKRQWKLLIDGEIACVWAITFSDEQIWEEKDNEISLYIHRIATKPKFRGHNFVKVIVAWAKNYALETGRRFVRLDTLGNNLKLIEHYTAAGFEFLGMFNLQNTDQLPAHYQGVPACLFEIDLQKKMFSDSQVSEKPAGIT